MFPQAPCVDPNVSIWHYLVMDTLGAYSSTRSSSTSIPVDYASCLNIVAKHWIGTINAFDERKRNIYSFFPGFCVKKKKPSKMFATSFMRKGNFIAEYHYAKERLVISPSDSPSKPPARASVKRICDSAGNLTKQEGTYDVSISKPQSKPLASAWSWGNRSRLYRQGYSVFDFLGAGEKNEKNLTAYVVCFPQENNLVKRYRVFIAASCDIVCGSRLSFWTPTMPSKFLFLIYGHLIHNFHRARPPTKFSSLPPTQELRARPP